jgi:predicted nucleic acid-binding protein
MIVVADTSPLNYLVLLGHMEILAKIYAEIVINRENSSKSIFSHLPVPERSKKWQPNKLGAINHTTKTASNRGLCRV